MLRQSEARYPQASASNDRDLDGIISYQSETTWSGEKKLAR